MYPAPSASDVLTKPGQTHFALQLGVVFMKVFFNKSRFCTFSGVCALFRTFCLNFCMTGKVRLWRQNIFADCFLIHARSCAVLSKLYIEVRQTQGTNQYWQSSWFGLV